MQKLMQLRTHVDTAYQWLWHKPLKNMSLLEKSGAHAGQILWVTARDLVLGRYNLQAMSLVYTTLLSLVPVLAIVFALLKAFGVHEKAEGLMLEFLAPLGEQGQKITEQTLGFVEQVNVGVLSSVGLAFLIYTLISTMQKVEGAFNEIWRVQTGRSISKRFTEFVSIGLLGPLAIFMVLGVLATALGSDALGGMSDYPLIQDLSKRATRLVPYLVMIGMFSAMYFVVPNTRVSFGAALIGGTVAGLLWVASGWTFANFVVTSARYAAIYSAFASLIFFIIWMYVAWLIVLTGCSVAYYFQNRSHLSPKSGVVNLTLLQMEQTALHLLVLLQTAFRQGGSALTFKQLTGKLHIPEEILVDILVPLYEGKYVMEGAGSKRTLLPARAAELMPLNQVVQLVRAHAGKDSLAKTKALPYQPIDELYGQINQANTDLFGQKTIADLLQADEKKNS
ncbi:MAG: YihY/virulence factor BrkB family protein [Parvibaculaceae bacterium]|nr:YihY/virulence factor BrkB family protein [Parvibaculaceae bacterium]